MGAALRAGPWITSPGKASYVTSTIRDLIPYEFHGTVDLVLAPEGMRCRGDPKINGRYLHRRR
jgi:hypothetical protein